LKKMAFAVLLSLGAAQADSVQGGVGGLSEGVRSLLSQEMLQIEQGMHVIFSSMVRGEYASIGETATQIQNSFIFKKHLTDAQRKELRETLPPAFIELDRSFHETAGDLAAAAEFGDKDSVAENYILMTRKCVQCHSTFARHRFTSFEE
jgi:cytochrome c556